jgi:hypothetical protein
MFHFEQELDNVSNVLVSVEFQGLTPLETLLKIFKENKKFNEENANESI